MEKQQTHLRKAKNWNLVMLILNGVGLALSIFGLPGALNPDPKTYESYGDLGNQMYENAVSIGNRIYIVIGIVMSLVIVILLFLAHRKLKEGFPVSKLPYYLYIGWTVIGIVYLILTTPNLEVQGVSIRMMTIIWASVFQVIFAIPAIITLVHLFKADTEE